jgi:hypothetical protein
MVGTIKRFTDFTHIKVEIKTPMKNNTDVMDERDLQVAKELVMKEWVQVKQQVDAWFQIVEIKAVPRSSVRLPE